MQNQEKNFTEQIKSLGAILAANGKDCVQVGWNEKTSFELTQDTIQNRSGGNFALRSDSVVVVDVDDPAQASSLFYGDIPKTAIVYRKSGVDPEAVNTLSEKGHLYFSVPDFPVKPVSLVLNGNMVVEVKTGKKCCTLIPPSIHPDTKEPYKWHNENLLGSLPPLPVGLYNAILKRYEDEKQRQIEEKRGDKLFESIKGNNNLKSFQAEILKALREKEGLLQAVYSLGGVHSFIDKGRSFRAFDRSASGSNPQGFIIFKDSCGYFNTHGGKNESGMVTDFLVRNSIASNKFEAWEKLGEMCQVEVPEDQKFYPGAIIESEGRTFIVVESRKKDKDKNFILEPREIANFTARIIRKIYCDEGNVSWVLKIKGVDEEKEKEVEFTGAEFASWSSFRSKAASKGLFLVSYPSNSDAKHNEFLKHLVRMSKFPTQKKTEYLGRTKKDSFLFCNRLATSKGVEELEGIIPPKGQMNLELPTTDLKEFWSGIVEKMKIAYGPQYWKPLGFCVGTLFFQEIVKEFSFFPLMFLNGEKGCGKSSLADLMISFFGAEGEIPPFNFTSTTKSWYRKAQKYRGIPMVLNEYRDSLKNNATLTALFDREGYSRARTDNGIGTHDTEVNATFVVLSTQQIIGYEASAVNSRMVNFSFYPFSEKTRSERKNAVLEIREQGGALSSFVLWCLKNLDGKKLAKDSRDEASDVGKRMWAEQRTIDIYSIVKTCAIAFLSSLGIEEDLVLDTEIKEESEKLEHFEPAHQFIEELYSLIENDKISGQIAKKCGDDIIFRLKAAYPIVSASLQRRGLSLVDRTTLARSLKKIGVKSESTRRFGSDKTVRHYTTPIPQDDYYGDEPEEEVSSVAVAEEYPEGKIIPDQWGQGSFIPEDEEPGEWNGDYVEEQIE